MIKSNKNNKVSSSKSSHSTEDILPDQGAIAQRMEILRFFIKEKRFDRIKRFMSKLVYSPPQVLLIEGGASVDRLNAAEYWALLLNCEELEVHLEGDFLKPCLNCASCIRFAMHMHRDFFYLDGLSGSIKIDSVREIKSFLGEPPREAKYRVVLFREAQSLGIPAANSLLKSLEEPQHSTSFLLLSPQRERLLPTLVSRSMILTLPWNNSALKKQSTDHVLLDWERELYSFLKTGRGWFSFSGSKVGVDNDILQKIIVLCSSSVVVALEGYSEEVGLSSFFRQMPIKKLRIVDEVLAEAQNAALAGVAPGTVLDWLATRLFLLRPNENKIKR